MITFLLSIISFQSESVAVSVYPTFSLQSLAPTSPITSDLSDYQFTNYDEFSVVFFLKLSKISTNNSPYTFFSVGNLNLTMSQTGIEILSTNNKNSLTWPTGSVIGK